MDHSEFWDLTQEELEELAKSSLEAKQVLQAKLAQEEARGAEPAEAAQASAPQAQSDEDAYEAQVLHLRALSLRELKALSREGAAYADIEYAAKVLQNSSHPEECRNAMDILALQKKALEEKRNRGDGEATYALRDVLLYLGEGYVNGVKASDDTNQTEELAFSCFQNAYELDRRCAERLAWCWYTGFGTSAEHERAINLLAESNDGSADSLMDIVMLYRQEGMQASVQEALDAADAADDCTQDVTEAVRWLRDRSAAQTPERADVLLAAEDLGPWICCAIGSAEHLNAELRTRALNRGAAMSGKGAARCKVILQQLEAERRRKEAERVRQESERAKQEVQKNTERPEKASGSGLLGCLIPLVLAVMMFFFVRGCSTAAGLTEKQVKNGVYYGEYTDPSGGIFRARCEVSGGKHEKQTVVLSLRLFDDKDQNDRVIDGSLSEYDEDDACFYLYLDFNSCQTDPRYALTEEKDTLFLKDENGDVIGALTRGGEKEEAAFVRGCEEEPDAIQRLLKSADQDVHFVTTASPEAIEMLNGQEFESGFYVRDEHHGEFQTSVILDLGGDYTTLSVHCGMRMKGDRSVCEYTILLDGEPVEDCSGKIYPDDTELRDITVDVSGVHEVEILIERNVSGGIGGAFGLAFTDLKVS